MRQVSWLDAMNLITEKASAVILDGDQLVYMHKISEGADEWMGCSWDDEENHFELSFHEEDNESVAVNDDGELLLYDREFGELTAVQLLQPLPVRVRLVEGPQPSAVVSGKE